MNARHKANIAPIILHPTSRERPVTQPAKDAPRAVSPSIVMGALRLLDMLCVLGVGWVSAWRVGEVSVGFSNAAAVIGLATIAMMNVAHFMGSYRAPMLWSWVDSMNRAVASWLVAIAAVAVLVLASAQSSTPMKEWLEIWAIGTTALLVTCRCAFSAWLARSQRSRRLQRRVVILGAGPIGQRLVQQMTAMPNPEFEIVGVYDDRRSRLPPTCLGYDVRGNLDDLIAEARIRPIDGVFIALPLSAEWRLAEIMNKLCVIAVDVRLCLGNLGFQIGECEVTHITGLTTLNVCDSPVKGWKYLGKLVEDKVLAAIILGLAAPVMAIVAMLIKIDSPGPVLFRQRRHGLNNELIEVLKFRSLYHHARDQSADRLCTRDDPRITRVGSFLRRTMLDELPQFINVLRGEMSIVGPRPHALAAKAGGLLYREAVKYYDARHRMKPGITGWAQIHGWRGETRTVEEIDQRVAHDLYYIQHWSILLDLKIILRTALGAFIGFIPRKSGNHREHAVPLADTGRSRSAA